MILIKFLFTIATQIKTRTVMMSVFRSAN